MVAFVFKIRVIVGWPMSNSLAIVLRVDFCNNIIRWLFLLKRQLNWSWLTFSSSCLIISNLWPIVSRWWGLLGGMITISMRDAQKRRQNWTRKVKKKSSKKASSVQRLVKRMKWRRKVGHRPAAASCDPPIVPRRQPRESRHWASSWPVCWFGRLVYGWY